MLSFVYQKCTGCPHTSVCIISHRFGIDMDCCNVWFISFSHIDTTGAGYLLQGYGQLSTSISAWNISATEFIQRLICTLFICLHHITGYPICFPCSIIRNFQSVLHPDVTVVSTANAGKGTVSMIGIKVSLTADFISGQSTGSAVITTFNCLTGKFCQIIWHSLPFCRVGYCRTVSTQTLDICSFCKSQFSGTFRILFPRIYNHYIFTAVGLSRFSFRNSSTGFLPADHDDQQEQKACKISGMISCSIFRQAVDVQSHKLIPPLPPMHSENQYLPSSELMPHSHIFLLPVC